MGLFSPQPIFNHTWLHCPPFNQAGDEKMKRTTVIVMLVVLAVSLLVSQTTSAQDSTDVITLNDSTPGIDVVITPVSGTTGAVALELYQASVLVTDSTGNTVFQMADSRVHRLELRLAPGANSYTLTAERLPGVTEALVRITPQLDLTQLGKTVLVTNTQQPVALQQSVDLALTSTAPSRVVDFAIPASDTGTMMVSFPGAPVTAQVVDDTGHAVATLRGSGFDAMSLVLDGGQYQLTLLNTDPAQQTLANMEIVPALPSTLDSTIQEMASQPAPEDQVAAANAPACSVAVDVSSVNLRSGPGTGYSVLGYGFRNDQFQVGGTNPGGSWLVVGREDGSSAWIARSTATLDGSCDSLAVYDIPYKEAPKPQVVVQQPPAVVVQPPAAPSVAVAASGGGSSYHEHEDEHEEHDD
jgi:uncharacterized protein YraI